MPRPYSYSSGTAAGRTGYASKDQLRALMLNRDQFSQRVTDELLENLLADMAHDLDTALYDLYEMPVTTAQPLAAETLQYINKYWALAELLDLMAQGAGDDDGTFEVAAVYREKGTQRLDDIVEGSVQLRDAVRKFAPAGPEYEPTFNTALDPDYGGEEPIFSVIEGYPQRGRIENS